MGDVQGAIAPPLNPFEFIIEACHKATRVPVLKGDADIHSTRSLQPKYPSTYFRTFRLSLRQYRAEKILPKHARISGWVLKTSTDEANASACAEPRTR